jgi:hypothetical protein
MKRHLGVHAEPYEHGAPARFARVSQACIVGGAVILALGGSRSRAAAAGGGALLSAGALGARWSVFKAGSVPAADPRYVVGPQRAGIERGERRGAARREPRLPATESAAGSPARSGGGSSER